MNATAHFFARERTHIEEQLSASESVLPLVEQAYVVNDI